jgi:hypothetical protein
MQEIRAKRGPGRQQLHHRPGEPDQQHQDLGLAAPIIILLGHEVPPAIRLASYLRRPIPYPLGVSIILAQLRWRFRPRKLPLGRQRAAPKDDPRSWWKTLRLGGSVDANLTGHRELCKVCHAEKEPAPERTSSVPADPPDPMRWEERDGGSSCRCLILGTRARQLTRALPLAGIGGEWWDYLRPERPTPRFLLSGTRVRPR